ncbi:MAG: vWA domain-containing protein [Opitutales bacterium]
MKSLPVLITVLSLFALSAWATRHLGTQGTLIPSVGSLLRPVTADPGSGQPARIDVAFVLDTTGSMSGLIEGAKRKIWAIASDLAGRQPAPVLRIGLVAYRDRGDAYVTRITPFSSDLDRIFAELTALRAGGGGDTPESVNEALARAVNELAWTPPGDGKASGAAVRTLFLVGDAPPHRDYPNDVPYTDTATRARQAGIRIHTIQCGNLAGTEPVWREIARLAEGGFVPLAQDGNMQVVTTPYDADIQALNRELSRTLVAYGDRRRRVEVKAKAGLAAAAPAATSADRQAFIRNTNRADEAVVTGSGDLIADLNAGRIDLDAVKDSDLDSHLQGLSQKAFERALEAKRQQRRHLQARLDRLLEKRAAHLREAAESAPAEAPAFDREVVGLVEAQIAERREPADT